MQYNVDYYRKHFRAKFLAALDNRYAVYEKRSRRNQFVDDFYNEYFKEIESSMKSWLSGKVLKVPPVEVLLRVCNILDCDVEYFFTDQHGFHKEINAASEEIGLQYETVEQLKRYNSNSKRILNTLVRPYNNTDEDTAYEAKINPDTDLLGRLIVAIDMGTRFGPGADCKIKDEMLGSLLNAASKEEVSSMVASYLSITFSEIVNSLKELTFNDRYYYCLWERVNELKRELHSQGMSQWEVDIEVDRRRQDIEKDIQHQMNASNHN